MIEDPIQLLLFLVFYFSHEPFVAIQNTNFNDAMFAHNTNGDVRNLSQAFDLFSCSNIEKFNTGVLRAPVSIVAYQGPEVRCHHGYTKS